MVSQPSPRLSELGSGMTWIAARSRGDMGGGVRVAPCAWATVVVPRRSAQGSAPRSQWGRDFGILS